MLTRSSSLPLAQFRVIARFYGSSKGAGISAAPELPTGIEYQLSHNKRGKQSPKNFEKEYKCIDYLHYNTWSFYDKENELEKHRVPQPTYKKPDTEPKVKTQ